jgi:hypothetical protein
MNLSSPVLFDSIRTKDRGNRVILNLFLIDDAAEYGSQADAQIEPERPVLDIPDIVLDTLFNRGIPAIAVDLRQPVIPGRTRCLSI